MSKKDRQYKAKARREKENARKETAAMIKRLKKDQFGWQSKKVN